MMFILTCSITAMIVCIFEHVQMNISTYLEVMTVPPVASAPEELRVGEGAQLGRQRLGVTPGRHRHFDRTWQQWRRDYCVNP
jgi:hypothetical protein